MSTYCRHFAADSVIFWLAFGLGNAAFSTALDVDAGLAGGITLREDISGISSSWERSSASTASIVQVENTERNAKTPSKAAQKRNQTSLSSPQGETFFDCLIVMPWLKPKNSLQLPAVSKSGFSLNYFLVPD